MCAIFSGKLQIKCIKMYDANRKKKIYICDVLSSMVTHTRNWSSAFNPSKCTHTAVNTHPEQWAAIAPAPGEQLGVRCLAQGHLSHGIEGGESAVHSTIPTSIPAGPETRTQPLDCKV